MCTGDGLAPAEQRLDVKAIDSATMDNASALQSVHFLRGRK